MAPRYFTKQEKCEDGEACECERFRLLEETDPCLFTTVRELTFDLLNGKIFIDVAYYGIFEYKTALRDICRPQIPHEVAIRRFLYWTRRFPRLQPLWQECMYAVRGVLFKQENKKQDGDPVSIDGCYYGRRK